MKCQFPVGTDSPGVSNDLKCGSNLSSRGASAGQQCRKSCADWQIGTTLGTFTRLFTHISAQYNSLRHVFLETVETHDLLALFLRVAAATRSGVQRHVLPVRTSMPEDIQRIYAA